MGRRSLFKIRKSSGESEKFANSGNTKKNDRELRIGIDYSFPGLDFTPALTLDAPLVQAAELRVHGLLGPHVEPLDEADKE